MTVSPGQRWGRGAWPQATDELGNAVAAQHGLICLLAGVLLFVLIQTVLAGVTSASTSATSARLAPPGLVYKEAERSQVIPAVRERSRPLSGLRRHGCAPLGRVTEGRGCWVSGHGSGHGRVGRSDRHPSVGLLGEVRRSERQPWRQSARRRPDPVPRSRRPLEPSTPSWSGSPVWPGSRQSAAVQHSWRSVLVLKARS